MTPNRFRAPGKRHSFTLVELLVVIAIGAILAVISAGAYSKIVRSTTVSTGSQMLTGALDFARQTAITRNTDVEFRIYELPDANASPSAPPVNQYRGFQTFLIADGTTNALTKPSFLPPPAVISANPAVSSIIGLVPQPASTFSPQTLPLYGSNYQALVFRFSPNGGLETPSSAAAATAVASGWFMSLVLLNDPLSTTGNTSLPANFATIQIDPFSGRAKVFRP
jgi:uncharacterized protein (TIGR02596 family)